MPIQARADCPENFDLIKSWLSRCGEKHPSCNTLLNGKELPLPTRLLDILDEPKLVLSKDLDRSGDCRYAALSHCWGDPTKMPKTLKESLAKHQKFIPTLSKTFYDAIVVTKEIGLRYIWIDSFCIIQDSSVDFEKECSIMHNVYGGAYVTISALGAADGSYGLFQQRDTGMRNEVEHFSWKDEFIGPLNTRGWAFQEQQISPRIIHFSQTQILWECRLYVGCEGYRSLVPRLTTGTHSLQSLRGNYTDPSWRLFDTRSNSTRENQENAREDLHFKWLRAVEEYSGRQLSNLKDKLPALSGLAAKMSDSLMSNEYWGGVWKDDLARSLFWTPTKAVLPREYSTAQPRNKKLPIPSWSWASVNQSIRFASIRINQLHRPLYHGVYPDFDRIEVSEDMYSRMQPVYRDFTEVFQAEFLVQGKTESSSGDFFGRVNSSELQLRMKTTMVDIEDGRAYCRWQGHPDGKLKSAKIDGLFLDEPMDPIYEGKIFSALFGLLKSKHWLERPGLLLKQVSEGKFERIGMLLGPAAHPDLIRKELPLHIFEEKIVTVI